MRKLFLFILFGFLSSSLHAQENLFSRNFNLYPGLVPGIDFFASTRAEVKTFEKPIAETHKRLKEFLGEKIAPGAIFICTTIEQEDSVYEPKAFRMGYRWILIAKTPDAGIQQMMQRMKSRMGGEIPPEMEQRIRQRASGFESRLVETAALQLGYAVITTSLNPEKEFRYSRLEDMHRSPLADWLDIGLAVYASGSHEAPITLLKRRIEEAFPIEDVLFMSRPVVVPTFESLNTDSARGNFGPPGGGMGGPSDSPREQSPRSDSIPKDVQDQRMFDAQAAAFFAYLLETLGTAKVREIVQLNIENQDIQEILERPEYLGSDFEAVENSWREWLNKQRKDSENGRPERIPDRSRES